MQGTPAGEGERTGGPARTTSPTTGVPAVWEVPAPRGVGGPREGIGSGGCGFRTASHRRRRSPTAASAPANLARALHVWYRQNYEEGCKDYEARYEQWESWKFRAGLGLRTIGYKPEFHLLTIGLFYCDDIPDFKSLQFDDERFYQSPHAV